MDSSGTVSVVVGAEVVMGSVMVSAGGDVGADM